MPSSFGFKKGVLNKKSSSSSSSSTTATTTTNPPPSTFQTTRTIPNENDAATEVAAETLPPPPLCQRCQEHQSINTSLLYHTRLCLLISKTWRNRISITMIMIIPKINRGRKVRKKHPKMDLMVLPTMADRHQRKIMSNKTKRHP